MKISTPRGRAEGAAPPSPNLGPPPISETIRARRLKFYTHLDRTKCSFRAWQFPLGCAGGRGSGGRRGGLKLQCRAIATFSSILNLIVSICLSCWPNLCCSGVFSAEFRSFRKNLAKPDISRKYCSASRIFWKIRLSGLTVRLTAKNYLNSQNCSCTFHYTANQLSHLNNR